MALYTNKNLVMFTLKLLKQTSFLKVVDQKVNTKMAYSSFSKLSFTKFGDPAKVVQLVEDSPTCPGNNEVLVKILLAPVNPADINTIQGVYPVKPPLPAIPGNEAVGVIEKVGSGVKDLAPGDRVVPNGEALGTWRTHAVLDASQVYKVRDDIDCVPLAGITSNPSTAYRMLKDFVNLKPGDTVIQNGANSAAGQNVIQLCKIWDVNTINIVRNRDGFNDLKTYLMELGATQVVRSDELRDFKIATTGLPKAVLGLNCVGGSIALEMLAFLEHNATIVTYGGMSRNPVSIPTSSLIFKNFKFVGYWMTRWYRENRGNEKHIQMFNDLMCYMKSNQLKPPRHQLVPLKDYQTALMNTLNKQGFIGVKYFLDMAEKTK